MTLQGRSIDDLPLTAYSTGVEPEPGLGDPDVAATDTMAPSGTAVPPADGEPDRDTANDTATAGHVRVPVGRPPPGLPLPEWLGRPRELLRDPRLLLGGVTAAGLALLVLSLVLGGGGPAGPDAANATQSAPPTVVPPPPGDASVEVSGKLASAHALTGATGSGPAVASRIDATWSDGAGVTLGLSGAASPGTRTTDATFVLTWTVLVDGAPLTFTSDSGECTIGMAVQPKSVTGSFVCKKLRSDDGKQVVDVRGTYRT